jgi:hypothetical protein
VARQSVVLDAIQARLESSLFAGDFQATLVLHGFVLKGLAEALDACGLHAFLFLGMAAHAGDAYDECEDDEQMFHVFFCVCCEAECYAIRLLESMLCGQIVENRGGIGAIGSPGPQIKGVGGRGVH